MGLPKRRLRVVITEACRRPVQLTAGYACQGPTARPGRIAHFTRADWSQLFLQAVVRKTCLRHIAFLLQRHFYDVSETCQYYSPVTAESSQSAWL
jgi:hypothetical protein